MNFLNMATGMHGTPWDFIHSYGFYQVSSVNWQVAMDIGAGLVTLMLVIFCLYALYWLVLFVLGTAWYLLAQCVLLPIKAAKFIGRTIAAGLRFLFMAVIRRISPRYADYLERKATEKASSDYSKCDKTLNEQHTEPAVEDDFASLYTARRPEFAFKDVHGMTILKAQLLEAVDKHKNSGKNGILLSGDPGNGKTFIAEALAGELKWRFMTITIADIESRFVGQSTEQLKAVFNAAARNTPLVLFFDECDSMLRDRASMMGGSNDEALKKANAFLTGVVDIRRNKNIIVIAATNYRDQLDAAATRDGRFDFKIEIPNPDKDARLGLLTKFSQSKDFRVEFEEGVLDRLVKRWEGFSVVRIKSIAEKILDNAKAQGKKSVAVKEAMAALRVIQGSLGGMVPEETPTLRDGKLHFDPKQREKLLALATRMENLDEVERLGGQVPKGVLFYGPPGTGKTAVAKSLAKTSGWALIATSGNELLNDNEAFAKLLKKARDLRPCIVFIDEADDVLQSRSTNPYGTTVTNRILAEMDGVGQLHDVMFIAATNHPDKLDSAVIRGGRFGEHYEFKKPEEDTVLTMVGEWIHGKKDTTPFHEEFTPEAVAEVLHGLSPSDIKDRLQQAVNTGVGCILANEGIAKITVEDLKAVLR